MLLAMNRVLPQLPQAEGGKGEKKEVNAAEWRFRKQPDLSLSNSPIHGLGAERPTPNPSLFT